MAKQRTVQDLKAQIATLRSVTPWDEVEANKTYHIPPIITLDRREILVLSKQDNTATYRRIGDKEQTERTMHKTSVFAKFLVKRKKF